MAGDLGATLRTPQTAVPTHAFWFGEDQARYVVTAGRAFVGPLQPGDNAYPQPKGFNQYSPEQEVEIGNTSGPEFAKEYGGAADVRVNVVAPGATVVGMARASVDGFDVNETVDNRVAFQPIPDALAEISVETNNYTADMGNVGGAVISAVLKSGTNTFRGNAFEFYRNSDLEVQLADERDRSLRALHEVRERMRTAIAGSTRGRARTRCATGWRWPTTRWATATAPRASWPRSSRSTRRSRACSTPGWRAIRSTSWPSGRQVASAA